MLANELDQMIYPTTNGHASPTSSGSRSPTLDLPFERDLLEFACPDHPGELLAAMGHLQRQNQFCDAVLRVGERELQVHRAVLAASSPFLFELFSLTADTHYSDTHHPGSMYKLKDFTFPGFIPLLDYMYTGRLSIAADDVGEVYRTAKVLRMEQATQACSAFLAARLTPTNCLEVRQHAEDDLTFRSTIDGFIQTNIQQVLTCKHANGLPELQVEIIGAEEALGQGGSEGQLFNLVLEWARENVDVCKPKVELLTEEVNMLYLNADNHLQDCRDVSNLTISDDDGVVDYKKHSRRRSTLKNQNQDGASDTLQVVNEGRPMPFHKFNINPERTQTEKEWSVIAILKQNDTSYAGLAVLAGKTMVITVHLRQTTSPATNNASGDGVALPLSPEVTDRCASLVPLDAMSSCRCAFGVCVVDDSIIVCGGYDRGECLVSVEAYSRAKGRWTKLPDMLHPRARFGAASLCGRVYAVGGSDGMQDLSSVHCLSFDTQKWKKAASISRPRSSVGVAELEGRLYCVGGAEGQRSLDVCEVYSPDSNKWTSIAPLNAARNQAATSAYAGGLVAVGGTDSWYCMNSVEMYSPATNTWTYIAPLNNLRRGAGVDVIDDKLWVLGGSDGVASLRLTEVYDPKSFAWTLGPQLNVPRANVSAASLQGCLYAIGGFSGKKFLSSMEVLMAGSQEWCSYHPARRSAQQNGSSNGEGDEKESSGSEASPDSAVHTNGPWKMER